MHVCMHKLCKCGDNWAFMQLCGVRVKLCCDVKHASACTCVSVHAAIGVEEGHTQRSRRHASVQFMHFWMRQRTTVPTVHEIPVASRTGDAMVNSLQVRCGLSPGTRRWACSAMPCWLELVRCGVCGFCGGRGLAANESLQV
jgi:hypothetical protein